MARGIIIKPGDIFRDLGPLVSALDVRGGGGSPKELRSDAGVMVQVGIEETLKRHPELIVQQVDQIFLSIAIATTASTTFSFPQDHYIQMVSVGMSVGVAADFEWFQLTAGDPAGTFDTQLLYGLAADMDDLANAMGWGTTAVTSVATPRNTVPFPIFGRANTDYIFSVRGLAVATVFRVMIYHTEAPQGVEIAH